MRRCKDVYNEPLSKEIPRGTWVTLAASQGLRSLGWERPRWHRSGRSLAWQVDAATEITECSEKGLRMNCLDFPFLLGSWLISKGAGTASGTTCDSALRITQHEGQRNGLFQHKLGNPTQNSLLHPQTKVYMPHFRKGIPGSDSHELSFGCLGTSWGNKIFSLSAFSWIESSPLS